MIRVEMALHSQMELKKGGENIAYRYFLVSDNNRKMKKGYMYVSGKKLSQLL